MLDKKIRTIRRSTPQNLDSDEPRATCRFTPRNLNFSSRSKIAVIGVGGRTGTMFAFELRNSANILAVGRQKEVELVNKRKLFVEKKEKLIQIFEEEVIEDTDFKSKFEPDIIFLTTKNPISSSLEYYFKKCKKKIPTLIISQNGIAAISDAKKTLKKIFGNGSEKIRIVRVVLFNPIEEIELENKYHIKYSLPIRIAISRAGGEALRPGSEQEDIEDIIEIFEKSGFELKEFPLKDAENLEFSKLFLNLIGMAAASRKFSVVDGFKNKEIFKEEVAALKEYIRAVELFGGEFLDFPHYPVKLFTDLLNFLPLSLLSVFRNVIGKIISRGRGGKPKDLNEIDYYNGAVIKLGKKTGVKTPANERIYKRALKIK